MFDPLNHLVRLLGLSCKKLIRRLIGKTRPTRLKFRRTLGSISCFERFEQRTVFDASLEITTTGGEFIEGVPVHVATTGASPTASFSYTVLKNNVNFASGNQSSFDFTPNDDGSYKIIVTVSSGSETTPLENTINVGNANPSGTLVAPERTKTGTNVLIRFSPSSDAEIDAQSLRFAFSTDLAEVENATYNSSSASSTYDFSKSASGNYTVYGRVLDKDGGKSAIQLAPIVVNNPPVPDRIMRADTEVGQSVFVSPTDIAYSDTEGDTLVSITIDRIELANGDQLKYKGTPLTNNTTISIDDLASLIYYPASNSVGDRSSIKFRANDLASGEVPGTLFFHVNNANGYPTFNQSVSEVVVNENTRSVIDASASNFHSTYYLDLGGKINSFSTPTSLRVNSFSIPHRIMNS